MMKETKKHMSEFRLPDWLSEGMVFQQRVPIKLFGVSAPNETVTLEVVKDPTDGRRVSKLDADYGVILSLETRTDTEGNFSFSLPEYKASSDTYTFVFSSGVYSKTVKDIRCGDVWVFIGSRPLHIPISKTSAPRMPLQKKTLQMIRFFSPNRSGRKEGEHYSFSGSSRVHSTRWVHVRDSEALSFVSSAVFSMAYHLADQLHYPIGVLDLALEGSTILSWMNRELIEKDEELLGLIKEKKLYLSESDWTVYFAKLAMDEKKEEDISSENDSVKKTSENASSEKGESSKSGKVTGKEETNAKGNVKAISNKERSEALLRHGLFEKLTPEGLMTVMYNHKLLPLKDFSIRGIVFAPDRSDAELKDFYPKLMRILLVGLSMIFGPKTIEDPQTVPSMILLPISPEDLDPRRPDRYLELNETLVSIRRKFPMPIGILGLHDLLLPTKTKMFTIGKRLASIALGIHFTPKMPSSSPECIEVEIISNKVMMTFDNTVDGLWLAENESVLNGFSICGEDRVYMPANARILHGIRVMVWHDAIKNPLGVTYGYFPVPHLSTFRNRADLPVLPFRFDREKSRYAPDLSFADCDHLEIVGKTDWDESFSMLPVYKTIKGSCTIEREELNKTQGSASLHIKYKTENSLFSFGPVLDYVTLFSPLDLSAFRKISVDIFNPDLLEKKLSIEGFAGETAIRVGLFWQTLVLEYESEGDMLLERLEFRLFDTAKSGELYVDNIRFLP